MPTSYAESIPNIIEVIKKVSPKKVLDIGIGNGKYGLLTKEYVGNDTIIDGIEAWEPYISDIHRAIYRKIYNEDVAKMELSELPKYDLYIMIDIIEHLPKSVGHRILRELNGLVLISTPIEDYRAHYENHFEDHVSHWTTEDFEKYAYEDYSSELSTIVLLDTSKRGTADSNSREVNDLRKELEGVYSSRSWRLTKVLRDAKRVATRKKAK